MGKYKSKEDLVFGMYGRREVGISENYGVGLEDWEDGEKQIWRKGRWADVELTCLRNLSSLWVRGTVPNHLVPGSNAHGTGTVCWGGYPTQEVVGSGLWRWI